MLHLPETIRIAIILEPEEAQDLSEFFSFLKERAEAVHLDLFGTGPAPGPDIPYRSLTEFNQADFDLILDRKSLSRGLRDLPESRNKLVTGPTSQVLEGLLLQLADLLKQQEINSGILNSATDAIVTINEEHVIVGYNRGAEKIFGYSREEALGQDLSIIIPPPHKTRHREYVERFLSTRTARVIGKHVQLLAQRRNGQEFPISISFSLAEIHSRLYFTGIVRDISEYKEMQERLVQAERLAAVGNTVSHIAHEIKNPLAIIGGFARQLLKSAGLDDKGRQKLHIMAEEVQRLENMIAEMRDFVRRPPPQKSLGELDGLLDEVIEFFEDTFQEHHIQVRQERSQLPPVNFDPQQLRQVMLNLFKNSLEAMPSGGELLVRTQVKGNQVEISVTDSGSGMTPGVVEKIFQPYFTTKDKGTGLGLAICQNIVQEHGGCILADSAPGQGSTFTVQLPFSESPAA